MQVTDAIRQAIPVFAAFPNADVYIIRAELIRAGIPVALAADIVEFLPVAVARAVLDGMGIRFADEYVRQTPQGRVLETKKLADEPVYREGQVVAGELSAIGDEAFLALVRRSPEYRAVSRAMDAGAKGSDLACGPPTMIANEGDRRTFDGQSASPGKSWWQFWK